MIGAMPSNTRQIEVDRSMDRRTDVVVISINYSPEPTGFAPHVAAFCEHLAATGRQVVAVTGFPFAPRWKRWPEYRGNFSMEEQRTGVRVLRNTHFIPRSPGSLVQRVLMEGTFCLSVLLTLVRHRLRAPILIYVGAQPSIAMLCRVVAALTRARYGLMINDLATGAARDVGIIKPGLISRCLHRFEHSAYRAAAGAVVLCDGFKRALIAEGYPAERVQIVRSPVDTQLIRPLAEEGREFRSRFGLAPEDFVVLFAGSMGLKQGLINVVKAAHTLSSELHRCKWILVGDGETRPNVERLILTLGVEKIVQIIPFQPDYEMSAMFASSDILLLNQLIAVKDTVIPSKLLTYMASGKPVVAAVNSASEGADLLRSSGGGMLISPEDPAALAAAVIALEADQTRRTLMGQANRDFAVRNFDQKKIMGQLTEFVAELAKY
jgi:colanic acid biosynthesis glycosyl transferase WcaI